MNKIILFGLSLMIVCAGLEASVTYSPSTGTYTVDKSGCVKTPTNKHKSIKHNSDKPAFLKQPAKMPLRNPK